MTDTRLFNGLAQQLGEPSRATADASDNCPEHKEDFVPRLILRPSFESRQPDDRCTEIFQIFTQILSLNIEKDKILCSDIGAQKSVRGRLQAEAYASSIGEKLEIRQNNSLRVFLFGVKRRASLGSMEVYILVCEGQVLNYRTDIVDAPIPMVLGLDVLDKHDIFDNTVTNTVTTELIFARKGWIIPLIPKMCHVYPEGLVAAVYTST